jgi:hypothetical protein
MGPFVHVHNIFELKSIMDYIAQSAKETEYIMRIPASVAVRHTFCCTLLFLSAERETY